MDLNELHSKYRNKELTEDEMFEGCINVIHHAIHKSNSKHTDDSFQEGCISALYCIRRYKGSEKYSLSTMIYRKIQWDMIRHSWLDRLIVKPVGLYNRNEDRTHISVVTDRVKRGNNESNILDTLKCCKPISEEVISINQAISELKCSRQKDMLRMYMDGYVMEDIGLKYSVSFRWVSQVIKDARYNILKSRYIAKDPNTLFTRDEIGIIRANPNIRSYELAEALNKPITEVYRLKTRLNGGNL